MTELLTIAIWVGFFAANMGLLIWLARRVRRRGSGNNVLSPIEEIWHPAIREYRFETEAYEERVVARQSPDEPLE